MNQQFFIALVIGIPFSLMAGMFVFLLSYREYSHHFVDKKKLLKLSLESACFAFIFFIILSLVIGTALSRMFK
jgi:uncharacterized membrane protein